MSILVTGIGFVGAYIVRDLLNDGHDVVVFGLFGGRPGQSEAFPTSRTQRTSSARTSGTASASSWATSATATS